MLLPPCDLADVFWVRPLKLQMAGLCHRYLEAAVLQLGCWLWASDPAWEGEKVTAPNWKVNPALLPGCGRTLALSCLQSCQRWW